jgi:hypothetical protein
VAGGNCFWTQRPVSRFRRRTVQPERVKKLPARARANERMWRPANGKAAQGEERSTPPPAGSIGGYVRVPAQATGGQPLSPELFQVLPLSHSLAGGPDSSRHAFARPCPVSNFSCARMLERTFFSHAESTLLDNQIMTGKSGP